MTAEHSVFEALESRIAFHLQKRSIARTFRKTLGYAGNFEQPRTHHEKVQFRKLYGNHAFYASVTDKFLVRNYVAEHAGRQYLIPLLGVYDRLDAATFEPLPDSFIIKANHGCKWNRIIFDKGALDVAGTVRYFNDLLGKRYGWVAAERHYNFIRPRIVIEELLRAPDGGIPWDYNFFCYNGPAGFEYRFAVTNPDGDSVSFDEEGNIVFRELPEADVALHAHPENFDEMVEVARALSAGFDFVRVDLYSVAGRVYFGELTCTPAQGYISIDNPVMQKMRDEMWRVDAENPRLYCHPAVRQSCPGEWRSLALGFRPGRI